MRHAKKRHQLNRFTSWHDATIKSLCRSILLYQTIRTTLQKARAVKPTVEKLISLAKENSLAAKRRAFAILGDHALVSLLFKEIGPRFEKRSSGFTRTLNLGRRRGDNAQLVIFELTEIKKKEPKKHKKDKEEKPQKEHEAAPEAAEEKKIDSAVKEKPQVKEKPTKKLFGGFKGIFKKERDSL